MRCQSATIIAVAAAAIIAAPLSSVSAHDHWHRGGGLLFGLAALGTAAVVGAATIATAPVRVLAAPAPGYYAPPPVYYAPAPVYVAPPVYAAPPVYYAPAPMYAVPPGYVLVPR
jgi:hypothetical protein